MTEKGIYQHFRPEEKGLVDKAYDILGQVQDSYRTYLTDFLDPRQLFVMQSVLNQADVQVFLSNDYIPSEYGRLLLAPSYYELDLADFELSLLAINYNSKFNLLTHAQIMGSLINKLGIKRSIFGDILVADGQAQVFVQKSMQTYFIQQVTKIGKTTVHLQELGFDQMLEPEDSSQEMTILASSMRLDKVLATVVKISRAQAEKLIQAEKVKVNYQTVTRSSAQLEIGDMVSVRSYGRFTLTNHQGLSKNGKHKLLINRLTHKK